MAPYDPELLDRARMQWQFADWTSLSTLDREGLDSHPERARLALLSGAARLQLGDHAGARRMVQAAREWGCDKRLVARLLVAGVHNTLGRASALLGLGEARVRQHFQQAVEGSGGDARLTFQARASTELARLSQAQCLPALAPDPAPGPFGLAALLPHQARASARVTARQQAVHDLGLGWAANTVNTVIFRHHGVLTDNDHQFTAFYVDQQTLRLVRRDLADERIETFDLRGEYRLADAHNSISLGIDRCGYLHVCYDHHGSSLRYRRSLKPWDIQGWTDELPMTGAHEHRVTYPCFIQPAGQHPDAPLMLLYRDGSWNKGSARLKVYDEIAARWEDRPVAVLSGAEQRPWTSNPYWNHPVRGTDGSLHLSFVWRTDSLGEAARINNINVCYAKSLDDGQSWWTSHDQPYRLPITQVNAETVHPVSPGSNLMNQTSMALDSRNRPHIVFYADDDRGIPQYQHVWFDGSRWHQQVVSDRSRPFALEGAGTLQLPISRPEILIDRDDNAYVIFRGDITHDRMSILKLTGPDYVFDLAAVAQLWEEDLGHAEPVVDRLRWQRHQVLSMLLQHNQQPAGDIDAKPHLAPVSLVDFEIR